MAKKWFCRLTVMVLLTWAAGYKRTEPSEEAPAINIQRDEHPEPADIISSDVYPGGGELEDIPMGTFHNGKQKVLCSIKMPKNYRFRAVYTPDGLTNVMIEETAGGGTLESALERGLTEQPCAVWRVRLKESGGGTDIEFAVISTANWTMENLKGYAPDAAKLGNSRNLAVYYTDAAALHLYYCLNPEYALLVRYRGRHAKGPEWKQLAVNLYDLIKMVPDKLKKL